MLTALYLLALLMIIGPCLTRDSTENIVDLTWPFDNNTVYWTGVQPFVYTKKVGEVRPDGSWYAMNEFCAGEHGGTHFDAPYHFNKNGWKVGDVPLNRLIVPGVTIDVSGDAADLGPSMNFKVKHLEDWQKKHGPFPANCVLLINFGWSKYYKNPEVYLGRKPNSTAFNFPGVSRQAADWIVNSGKIIGVGVDTASIDPGNSTDFYVHKVFGANQIYNLENVNIPYNFAVKGYTLYIMPMKIQEGTGAPLRLTAVINDSNSKSAAKNINFHVLLILLLAAASKVVL